MSTPVNSVGSVSPSQLDQMLRSFGLDDQMSRDVVDEVMGMEPERAQQLSGQAQDIVNMQGHNQVDLQRSNPTAPGQAVHASSPPRSGYNQGSSQPHGTGVSTIRGSGFSTRNIGANETIKLHDGREFSGHELQTAMNRVSPEARQAMLDRNPALSLGADGALQVRSEGPILASVAPGRGSAPVGQVSAGQQAAAANNVRAEQNAMGFLGRMNGWKGAGLGFLMGGVSGAVVGGVTGKMLGDMSSGGGSTGGLGSLGGFGMGAGIAGGMGMEGMAFQMKKQAKAIAHDMGDQAMIGMINNKSIPIEDLIFMFMAYMSNKYEDRLRDKMEEAAMAEKFERRREMQQDRGRMISGVLSAFGPKGAIAGSAITMGIQKKMEIEAAVNGGGKSSTILMSEVQMLMHKWKQLTELLSNLMKSIHDMAMTPIRNMR